MSTVPPKKKKFPVKSKILLGFLQSWFGILFINWVFQGIRGMQYKEVSFRILLETIVLLLIYELLISSGISSIWSFLISLLFSHTINWLFNTHLWVCMRYMKFYRRNPDALREFLRKVSSDIQQKSWLSEAVCIGSVGDKGDVTSWRSDIDLRLFFGNGILNYFCLNLYLIYLRTWALINVIPLDLYAYDDISKLHEFKLGEGIKVIKDDLGLILKEFPNRVDSNDC